MAQPKPARYWWVLLASLAWLSRPVCKGFPEHDVIDFASEANYPPRNRPFTSTFFDLTAEAVTKEQFSAASRSRFPKEIGLGINLVYKGLVAFAVGQSACMWRFDPENTLYAFNMDMAVPNIYRMINLCDLKIFSSVEELHAIPMVLTQIKASIDKRNGLKCCILAPLGQSHFTTNGSTTRSRL